MQSEQDPNSQQQAEVQQKSMGKWMMFFAWIAALIVLTTWFDDLLLERINPNTEPTSYSSQYGGIEVRLKRNAMGHYVTSGKINGQPVTFLLDTGATDVSIPAHLATQLGLSEGARLRTRTANGTITVRETHIDSINIGDIQLRNIEGNLNPGLHGDEILLGMSALKKLEFQQKDGWLILRDY
ncbi:retropepsin-like aspartic protease family protein [Paraneptunicella aestuarii]|uniref:retropepsin-like aspartic protease family protein n=1 Tax=Paraneptunicella aestuarii TaxID=2831148 RepID=UPI001E33BE4C|nr:TIGR02281 family clan AA aspartic protease [Paraneptunicella aestuarii]